MGLVSAYANVNDLSRSIKSHRQIFGRQASILPQAVARAPHAALRREKPNTWRDLRVAGGVLRSHQAAFEPTLLAPARQMTCGFGALCVNADHLRNRRGFYSFAYC